MAHIFLAPVWSSDVWGRDEWLLARLGLPPSIVMGASPCYRPYWWHQWPMPFISSFPRSVPLLHHSFMVGFWVAPGWFHTPMISDWVIDQWFCSSDCCRLWRWLRAIVSNLLGCLTWQGRGIVQPIGSFFLIFHPFESGMPWIGSDGPQASWWVLYQSVT